MNTRLLLNIIPPLLAALSASASELQPTRDDPLSLFAVSPKLEFIVWWPDAKNRTLINHFPTFKATDPTYSLQYCRFDPSLVSLECSRTLAGEIVAAYARAPIDTRLSHQLHSESSGAMNVWNVYSCIKGCSSSVPKRFALVLWDTGG